jgi:cation transport ATPase
MKKSIKRMLLVVLPLFLINMVMAQSPKGTELKIKTSSQCVTCKETLEKAMAYEKGVKESSLDVESKILTVWYNPEKTTPEKIRKAINLAGYDADDTKADPKAYSKLKDCCKKPEDRHDHSAGCHHE